MSDFDSDAFLHDEQTRQQQAAEADRARQAEEKRVDRAANTLDEIVALLAGGPFDQQLPPDRVGDMARELAKVPEVLREAGRELPPVQDTVPGPVRWAWLLCTLGDHDKLDVELRKLVTSPSQPQVWKAVRLLLGKALWPVPDNVVTSERETDAGPHENRRRCYDRDHTWLKWYESGMGPAAIRDKWNAEHLDEKIGLRESGRLVVITALKKARAERKHG
jgi:hypothetical protein